MLPESISAYEPRAEKLNDNTEEEYNASCSNIGWRGARTFEWPQKSNGTVLRTLLPCQQRLAIICFGRLSTRIRMRACVRVNFTSEMSVSVCLACIRHHLQKCSSQFIQMVTGRMRCKHGKRTFPVSLPKICARHGCGSRTCDLNNKPIAEPRRTHVRFHRTEMHCALAPRAMPENTPKQQQQLGNLSRRLGERGLSVRNARFGQSQICFK